MWPELKVDQSPVGVAICLERQQGNDKCNEGKDKGVTSKQLAVDTLYSQQKLEKRMWNAPRGKGCKTSEQKIMNHPREKAKTRNV